MSGRKRASFLAALCFGAALVLAACHKEDTGASVLDPEPGLYKGAPVASLSPQALAELAKRVKFQEYYNYGGPK